MNNDQMIGCFVVGLRKSWNTLHMTSITDATRMMIVNHTIEVVSILMDCTFADRSDDCDNDSLVLSEVSAQVSA